MLVLDCVMCQYEIERELFAALPVGIKINDPYYEVSCVLFSEDSGWLSMMTGKPWFVVPGGADATFKWPNNWRMI